MGRRSACRLLDIPSRSTPAGIRDRALLSVLAYSACRVGELVQLSVGDFKTNGGHRVLQISGKGGKERTVPLHLEAVERLIEWLDVDDLCDDRQGPLFRPARTPRGQGRDGFTRSPLNVIHAYQHLIHAAAQCDGLDWAQAEVDRLIAKGTSADRPELLKVVVAERARQW